MNLYNKIYETNGRIFTVKFFKRSDGKFRVMNCRLGVKKDLKGDGPKHDARSKNLITVYDMQAEGYRNINMNCIVSVKINGEEYHNENLLEDVKQLSYSLNKD